MVQLTIEEAALRLPQLVDEADAGEEFVLTRNNQPVFKLVRVAQDRPRPRRGSAEGLAIYIADDFDAPLDDFKEYMP